MTTLVTKSVMIDDWEFQLRALPVVKGRALLPLVRKAQQLYALPYTEAEGLEGVRSAIADAGPTLAALEGGLLTEGDIETMLKAFAFETIATRGEGEGKQTLNMGDSKTCPKPEVLDTVFGAAYENVYALIDAAVDFNFSGLLGKIARSSDRAENERAAMAARRAAEQESQSQTGSTGKSGA